MFRNTSEGVISLGASSVGGDGVQISISGGFLSKAVLGPRFLSSISRLRA